MPKVMAASIGLFVSMVCLVLLLAKLIKSIALSVWNTTPKDMKLYAGGRKLDRFSKRMVQYSNSYVLLIGLFC
jgi:hypothetical protein